MYSRHSGEMDKRISTKTIADSLLTGLYHIYLVPKALLSYQLKFPELIYKADS